MTGKIVTGVVIGVAVIAGAVFFFGFGRRCHGPGHRMHHFIGIHRFMGHIGSKLDLTGDQKKTLDRIIDEVKAKFHENKAIRDSIADAVLNQIKSDTVDQAALNRVFTDNEPKMREMRTFLVAKFAEFHGTLTPVQKKKLADLAVEHRDRMKKCRI